MEVLVTKLVSHLIEVLVTLGVLHSVEVLDDARGVHFLEGDADAIPTEVFCVVHMDLVDESDAVGVVEDRLLIVLEATVVDLIGDDLVTNGVGLDDL